MSVGVVSGVWSRAKALKLDWAAVDAMDDDGLATRLYGPRTAKGRNRPLPDAAWIDVTDGMKWRRCFETRRWLEVYAAVNNRPSEVVSKQMILRVHILPFFDNQTLDAITSRDVRGGEAEARRGQEPTEREDDEQPPHGTQADVQLG